MGVKHQLTNLFGLLGLKHQQTKLTDLTSGKPDSRPVHVAHSQRLPTWRNCSITARQVAYTWFAQVRSRLKVLSIAIVQVVAKFVSASVATHTQMQMSSPGNGMQMLE